MVTSAPSGRTEAGHRFRLGRSRWWMWRDGVLRSAGFPVSGLERLSAPALAALADAHLAGQASAASVEAEVCRVTASLATTELERIASDDRFREAVTWEQSPVLADLDPARLHDAAWRHRLVQQWQRYCASNDTMGFFGPCAWMTLDPESVTTAVPGQALLAVRRVFLEPWALAAYGTRLAADPAIRLWLPPAPRTHFYLDGVTLRRPGQPPLRLTPAEAATIAACDGRRPAFLVASELAASGAGETGGQRGALAALENLAARGLLQWDANLPVAAHAEEVLDERIAAIEDEGPRTLAAEGLDRLRSARDTVAGAAGDPDALTRALGALHAVFSELTGCRPHRPRYSYPHNTVCYEETLRDVRVIVGRDLLDPIGPALALVLQAARWLTAELAGRFEDALAGLVAARGFPGASLTLADIWDDGVDLLFGPRERRLVPGVQHDFRSRWRELLKPDDGAHEMAFSSAVLEQRAGRLFAADRPGWSMARIHSPDILVAAPSVAAINDGSYTAVLGELHIAHATHCVRGFAWALPDMYQHLRLASEDYGRPRLIPLIPRLWTGYAARQVQFSDQPADTYVAFAPSSGVEADRVLAACAVTIERCERGFAGRLPDGTLIPLIEFFGGFLSLSATDSLREAGSGPHTPRVTIDRLVVWRESWRLAREDVGTIAVASDTARYLAGRRLIARLGAPDQCFVRLSTDRKPMYVDFTSPLYVSMLGSLLCARLKTSPDLEVIMTELLPTPAQAWLRDAEGNRYFSEFRLQVTDPERAASPKTMPG
jgi:hypothetical protein